MKRFVLVSTAATIGVFALAQGCSGSSSTLPDASTNDSGSLKPDASAVVSTDASDGAPDSKPDVAMVPDTGTANGVFCGVTTCAVGQLCCPTISNGSISTTCAASCPSGNALACDGPEDCAGNVCCGTTTTDTGTFPNCPPTKASAKCESTCTSSVPFSCASTSTVRLCHTASECTEPGYGYCCTFSLSGNSSTFCASPLIAAFGTNCTQ